VHNKDIYDKFFKLVKSIFRVDCDPQYSYSKQLFWSCTPPCKEKNVRHKVTIIQGECVVRRKHVGEAPGSSLDNSTMNLVT
jgi:hypothetical protein